MGYARSPFIPIARGALAFLLSLILLSLLGGSPSTTLVAVAFGTATLVDGVLAFVAGLRVRQDRGQRWLLCLEGTIGVAAGEVALSLAVRIGAGSAAFSDPHSVVSALSLLIGARAAALGATQSIAASSLFRNARVRTGGVLSLSALSSLLFGVVLVASPGRSGEALVLQAAIYSIVIGALFATTGMLASRDRRSTLGQPVRREAQGNLRNAGHCRSGCRMREGLERPGSNRS